jgi:BirA family biotin operon repressor/biotin-[acetyl-CoA-carboxylase] ligase
MSLEPDAFDVTLFSALRRSAGLGWGEPLVYRAETGSTSDDALAAARQGQASGSVFVAEHQTQGRGRRGRRWHAASGQSLLFSVLLRPSASVVAPGASPSGVAAGAAAGAASGALTLAVGLGVRAALAGVSQRPLRVKWPNDILCERKKLAGILCESQLQGAHTSAVVIGVGINVGEQAFSPELAPSSICLRELAELAAEPAQQAARGAVAGAAHGRAALGREALLVSVLSEIERRVAACLKPGEIDATGPLATPTLDLRALLAEFRQHDALRDQRVQVSGARELTGIARGVDDEGRLLLETDGILLPIHSGTVRLLEDPLRT